MTKKCLYDLKKIITKAVDEISQSDWFYFNQYLLKFLFKLIFCVTKKIFMCLMNVFFYSL